MDHLQKFVSQVRSRLFLILLGSNLLIIADWWLSNQVFKITGYWLLAAMLVAPLFTVTIVPWLSASYLTQPMKLLWQAILHIAPDSTGVPAPDMKSIRIGRELVTNLISHIYQLASVADNVERLANAKPADLKADFIANNLPLPLIVLNKEDVVLFANEALLKYIGRADHEVLGKDVYSVLDMSFVSVETFDAWLAESKKNTVTADKTWDRVRLNREDQPVLQFDLAAHYNKANPEHIETVLVLFDHTSQYGRDDQAMSFVALAVHELRTPLTLMRGYIEALDEELDGKLNDETKLFLQKMNVAAQSLTTFVNNILNVARIESDQLELQLREESWPKILNAAVATLRLRTQVHDIQLMCTVSNDLPPVGIDRDSITEVISNLIDNAIKYSGDGKKIVVESRLTTSGEVETTVQDFGIGIPESVVPKLFTKFYRSHRSKAKVGGTGLGLYLSKAIVAAHGGNIWVRSTEGKGSTFGFTVLPYANLGDEQKTGENQDITRSAHGWIKNHSMFRR